MATTRLPSISRSLLPSILARMPEQTSGYALELSQERVLGWALERVRHPRPVIELE